MKKILIVLLAVTMASSVMIAGCSNKSDDTSSTSSSTSQTDSSSSEDASSEDNTSLSEDLDDNEKVDGDFVWQDDKYITNLSEEGAKKKELVIPENCQAIFAEAYSDSKFCYNSNLESIKFESDQITELPNKFFMNDTSLEKVELPKKLTEIPDYLFASCEALKGVEIPSTVEVIGERAFESCLSLKELRLPESVKTVKSRVFKWMNLEKLYLPESLTSIDENFLYDMDDSAKLTVYVKKGSYADEHFDDYAQSGTTKEYY